MAIEETKPVASPPRRWLRLVTLAVLIVLGFGLVRIAPIWLVTLSREWVPRWVARGAAIGFLMTLRVAYLLAVLAAVLGVAIPLARILRGRRRGRLDPAAARLLLLSLSTLLGVAFMEGAAVAWQAWSRRMPDLPLHFADDPRHDEPASANRSVFIAVIGESSAKGTPYHLWLSVAQIAAWQLERVFPGRKFDVQIEAAGGLTLEEAIRELRKINRRPDAIVIYSGHNEFQARYGWSRNVKYYLDEKPRQRGALVALTGRLSPLCGLIEDTIDKHRVDEPPPKDAHRELIDHPSFTPEEYAFLRTDFHRRLEGIVAYCERIGALPILISPAGNEGDFPPDRSYLFPAVPLADREAAARRFQEARSIELTDPAAAVRLFRALLAQHPTFAEAHYRLAKLLEQGGEWPLAREHYLKARDCDGLPMRCPTDFLAAYPEVARRHDAIFVDGPAVFARLSPHGIIDDHLIHDGQHPTLRGYIALTQDLLEKLHTRHAFGWPDSVATPVIDPSECASHFELDAAKWSFVCHHTAGFHARTSKLRYDPSEHLARVQRLVDAANQIEAGKSPDEVGITGLGVHPSGLRER